MSRKEICRDQGVSRINCIKMLRNMRTYDSLSSMEKFLARKRIKRRKLMQEERKTKIKKAKRSKKRKRPRKGRQRGISNIIDGLGTRKKNS